MNLRLLGAVIVLGAIITTGCSDDVAGPTGTTVPTVASIVLELEADTLSVNETTRLQATALSADGDSLSDEVVTFQTSDEGIVTVSETGLVTAKGPGTVTITARSSGLSAAIPVYVRRAFTISVTPTDTTLIVGDTLNLTAKVLDVAGNPVPNGIVWWTDNDFVVNGVDKRGVTGRFRGVGAGTVQITAATESLTATVDVRVVSISAIGSVSLSPESLTVTIADTVHPTVTVRDTTGAVIANPEMVFVCQSAPVPPDARQGPCRFDLITLDSTSFMFGSGTYMEGIVEVVARSGGVNSNPMYVFLAFGDPNNPWDY